MVRNLKNSKLKLYEAHMIWSLNKLSSKDSKHRLIKDQTNQSSNDSKLKRIEAQMNRNSNESKLKSFKSQKIRIF